MTGVNVGGLAVVASGGVTRGLNVGGLAVVGSEGVEGLNLAGLAVTGEDFVNGVTLAGFKIQAREARWVTGALWKVEVRDFEGVSVAGWTEHEGYSRGLSVGILNRARELEGIQIGLLNFAGNNARFRWLPLVNAHF